MRQIQEENRKLEAQIAREKEIAEVEKRRLQQEIEKAKQEQERLAAEKRKIEEIERQNKNKVEPKIKQTSAQGRYQQFENGIIYDNKEKLEWFIGPNKDINWADAASWVENLNHQQLGNGWRLPDVGELRSLYNDEIKNFHAIFKNEFLWVWSGTLYKQGFF